MLKAGVKPPKITVVTVVYNAVSNIRETLESVLNQEYCDLEYIVIDGGSTDGTQDIVRHYEDKLAVYISEPDEGIYDAMNKAADYATGEYINFMNAGDVFSSKSSLREMLATTGLTSDLFLAAHRVKIGNGEYKVKTVVESSIRNCYFPLKMPACHQSMFVKTDLFKKLKFESSYRLAADYHQLCSSLALGASVGVSEVVVSTVSPGGVSDLKRCEVWSEYQKIRRSFVGESISTTLFYSGARCMERIKCGIKVVFNKFLT